MELKKTNKPHTKNKQSQKTVKVSNLVAKGKEALEGAGSYGMDLGHSPGKGHFKLQFQGVIMYFVGLLFNVKHEMQR